MLGLSAAVNVYVATAPADMRRSFDGLSALGHKNRDVANITPLIPITSPVRLAPTGGRIVGGRRGHC